MSKYYDRAVELRAIIEPHYNCAQSVFLPFAEDAGLTEEMAYKVDLRQEAILNFYNSILNFDTEQSEVEFGLYSKICISNALISQLRLHKKHTAEQLSASLNNMFFVHDSEDPSERILEEERVQALHSLISKNLSKYEYRIWQLYMSGRTAKEIGDTVGKSEKSIENAIYRTRKKLRSILN